MLDVVYIVILYATLRLLFETKLIHDTVFIIRKDFLEMPLDPGCKL